MLLDQLWFTWTHRGLEVTQGFQVRAASAGLRDLRGARLAALRPHLTYALPAGCDPASTPPGGGPRSLALVDLGDERALLHRVYAGRDPFARPGNFFVHALVGAAEALPLTDAALSWGAPLWMTADQDGVDARQPLPALDLASLAEGRRGGAPSLEGIQDVVAFALEWRLTSEDGARLFLAAAPEAVAAIVFALSQALPRFLWRRITFSTFERDVLRSPATVVGVCWPAAEGGSNDEPDLPPACYINHAAFNHFSGKRSRLPADPDAAAYAAWAVAALRNGASAQLGAFLAAVDAAGCERVAELLLAQRYWEETAELPASALAQLLAEPRAGALLLRRDDLREGIIRRIRDDGAWWAGQGRDDWQRLVAVVKASERPDEAAMQGRLVDAVHGSLVRAVDQLQIATVARLLEARQVLPGDDAGHIPDATAQQLLSAARRPGANLPEDDWFAMLKLIGVAKHRPPARDIAPLLSAPLHRTAEALSLALPQDWEVLIAANAIRAAVASGSIADIHGALEQHPGPFELALKRLLADSRATVAAFMRQGAAVWSAGPECLLELLRTTGYDDPAFYADLASCAIINLLPERLSAFVDAQASVLLRNGALSPTAPKLLRHYLVNLSVDRCRSAATAAALRLLANSARDEPGWPDDLRRLLNAWHELTLFLTYGNVTPDSLGQLRDARRELERRLTADTMRAGRDAIDREIVKRLIRSIHTEQELEASLTTLSSVLKERHSLFSKLLEGVEYHEPAEQRGERRSVYWRYGLEHHADFGGALHEQARRLDPARYRDLDARLQSAVQRGELSQDDWRQWRDWTKALRPNKPLHRLFNH